MSYQVSRTPLEGVLILEPKVFGDSRGFFYESFNARTFEQATGVQCTFVQDNHSKSNKGVLRGMHYQTRHPQGKLVRVTQGEVFDVVVDIRKESPTFGQWFGQMLSVENKRQMWIPKGMAHGFLVTSDSAEFLYKTTDYYYPEFERSLLWSDADVGIEWPLHVLDTDPILAPKDAVGLMFKKLFKEP
jgi:dTDP-4-dehydrorhamnose 3,5-epimerase